MGLPNAATSNLANLETRGTLARSLRPKDAAALLGIGLSTLWRYSRRPDFPQPMRLSARCTVFAADAVLAWRNAQAVAREEQ
jgi:predicted DNA-binding transcriptional regulator AlpA